MDPGLVTALSGAIAQSKSLEKIANNLANADTPGFKTDELLFEESLAAAHKEDTRSDIPQRALKESELLNRQGDANRPVLYGEEFTNMRQGTLKQTGHTLDLALEGNAFFEVLTPEGLRLTRAGNFNLDGQGRLVTREGHPVLGAGGNPVAERENPDLAFQRVIQLDSNGIIVDKEGQIYSRAQGADPGFMLASLSLVQVENPSDLKKVGGNFYEPGEDAGLRPFNGAGAAGGAPPVLGRAPAGMAEARTNPFGEVGAAPRVHQGYLEQSNVNPIHEMSRMIEAQRLFEQNIKMMQGFGELNSRVSEIGKF